MTAQLTALKEANDDNRSTNSPETTSRLNQIESTVSGLIGQVDYIDNQSRRNNIRIDSIVEGDGES